LKNERAKYLKNI